MANWNFNRLRLVGKWLTRVLPTDYQVRIGARLEQGISGVYHEHQRRQQEACFLRALNNLLQGEGAFTRRELNGIAAPLQLALVDENTKPWWSRLYSAMQERHGNLFRDYSTNLHLLRPALATRNKTMQWYGGLPMASYGDQLVGILLNSAEPVSNERHWVAFRMVGSDWYNLDSFLHEPSILPNGEDDLKQQMESAIQNSGCVVIVLEDDVAGMM